MVLAKPAVRARSRDVGSERQPSWSYRAFGVNWESSFPWPIPATPGPGAPDVTVELAADLDALWSGHADGPDWLFRIDGRRFVIQRGATGDFRLFQQHGVRFHIDSRTSAISCDRDVATDPPSQRLLLDTVLWTTTILRGLEGIHASAVRGPAGVVGFLASSGGGKTSLAAELIRRGYPLVCDDVLILERRDEAFLAHPSPPVMNLPLQSDALDGRLTPIAEIGDEHWVSVAGVDPNPAPLAHLVILDRGAAHEDRRVTMSATALDLLPYAQFHALVDAWERRRFEFCCDLAAAVPVSRLEAGAATPPARIADLLEPVLAGEAS